MELAVHGNFGMYLRGYLDANGLQVKTIAAKRGLDPSTFSKKTNRGSELLSAEEAFLIGVATGEARAEQSSQKNNSHLRVNEDGRHQNQKGF